MLLQLKIKWGSEFRFDEKLIINAKIHNTGSDVVMNLIQVGQILQTDLISKRTVFG